MSTEPHRPRGTAASLVVLFAAGVVGVVLPLLLGVGLYRCAAWLTGGAPR